MQLSHFFRKIQTRFVEIAVVVVVHYLPTKMKMKSKLSSRDIQCNRTKQKTKNQL